MFGLLRPWVDNVKQVLRGLPWCMVLWWKPEI
jgi:hypothetical protein